MAKDGWAHVVLMAALTFTDDTALLNKVIVSELQVSGRPLQAPAHNISRVSLACNLHILQRPGQPGDDTRIDGRADVSDDCRSASLVAGLTAAPEPLLVVSACQHPHACKPT